MYKEIRLQAYKMTFIVLMLLALGVWQFQFVIDAIRANIFLNMTIFGTFAFGAFAAYKNVLGLRNEVVAFEALKEDYDDRTNSEEQLASDPYWRYYRCKDNAQVFQNPEVLEHPFHIISEELGRTNTLAMSTGTMQNLTDSVDARLDDRKSLVQYVTGILVFLGLIGTFVGLMVTLGSVGDIIGNLDLSGGAGAEAIQGLMDGLKVPLQGMATGFSSSLFGLITSLTLGLMARFASQASSILKTNFETWLAGAAIVGEGGAAGSAAGGYGIQERQLDLMFRVARFSLVSNAKMMHSVEAAADATQVLAASHEEQTQSVGMLTQAVGQMLQSQDVVNRSLVQTNEVLEDRQKLSSVMEDLRADAAAQQKTYDQVNGELEKLTQRQRRIQEATVETTRKLASREDVSELMSNVDRRLAKETGELRKSIEGVTGIVREIDVATKSTAMRKVELDITNVGPLVDELTRAIALRSLNQTDTPEVPMEDIRTARRRNAHSLSVSELRQRLFSETGAVEESEEAVAQREAKAQAGRSLTRFFKGRG